MADVFQLVGQVIDGKYRVDGVVGEGGFGVVYRGHHQAFDVAIAVKCLKVPAHFTPDARRLFLEKFREEGRHLAKLSEHPSITRVYDIGTAAGPHGVEVPFLVLEWLEGTDLERLLAARRERGITFPELEALAFLRPAIDALALAHEAGVAHRDIKPANLMYAAGKRRKVLKVLDFGIAKAMQEGETATMVSTNTSSGFNAFSPKYGAPEQFRAKKLGATGPWTDVHALGLVLVEMVTGRAALAGDEMADFLLACDKDERPTPRRLGAQVSDAFEALCERALARSPADRFANAGELLRSVDDLCGPAAANEERVARIAAALDDVRLPAPSGEAVQADDTGDYLRGRGLELASEQVITGEENTAAAEDVVVASSTTATPDLGHPTGSGRGVTAGSALAGASGSGAPTRPVALSTDAPSVETVPTPARRRRWVWAAGGLLAMGSAAAGVGFSLQSGPEAVSAPSAPERTAPPPVVPPARPRCPPNMAFVAGGTFIMGSEAGDADERPVHEAKVGAFCIEKTEVTVAAYRQCVDAGQCETPAQGGLHNWDRPGREDHPINGVSWRDAATYCAWKLQRLPTETEWEYAARGPEGRTYPWGEDAPGAQLCWSRREGTCPAGSFASGATPEGVLDLAGNVFEWVESAYCPYSGERCSSDKRVERGGSWNYVDAAKMRSANRVEYGAAQRNDHLGFRCAAEPAG